MVVEPLLPTPLLLLHGLHPEVLSLLTVAGCVVTQVVVVSFGPFIRVAVLLSGGGNRWCL
jgi:hypothetical protein